MITMYSHTYMYVCDLHIQMYIIHMYFQASEWLRGKEDKRKKSLFSQNLGTGNQSMQLTNAQGCKSKSIRFAIRQNWV